MRKFLSVLLALMMVVSTVSFAAPSAVTVEDSATNAAVVETANETTENVAELAANTYEVHDDYGVLVYKVDFEQDNFDLTTFTTNYGKANKVASYLNPDFDISNLNCYTNAAGDGFKNAKLVTKDGNTYIQGDVNANYSGFFRMTKYNCAWPTGYYTFVVDVQIPSGQVSSFAKQCNDTAIALTALNDFNTTDGGWQTVVYQTTNVVDGNAMYGFFVTPNNATAGTVAYDNWEVYYKPAGNTVDITIDPNNGEEVETLTVPFGMSVQISELKSYFAEVPGLLGFSETPDGDILSDDTVITAYVPKTYYAIWELDVTKYGTPLFDIDFENYNNGDTVIDNKEVEVYDADAITNGEFKINWEVGNASGNKVAQEADGNKYIRGGQGYAQFRLTNTNAAMPKGTYTLIADVIDFGSASRTVNAISQGTGANNGNVDAVTVDGWKGQNNKWDTVIAQWDSNSIPTSDMTIYFTNGLTTDVGFDNIRLVYEPYADSKFNVTVNKGANSSATNASVSITAGEEVAVSTLKTAIGCSGISLTENGEMLADDAKITPLYNQTVYAVWLYDVTIDNNGNSDVSSVTVNGVDARNGITVAELLDRITNNSDRTLRGISTTADGEPLAESTVIGLENSTLYMIWEADESQFGTLIFDIDFENYNVGDMVSSYKTAETYDPDAIGNGEFTLTWHVSDSVTGEIRKNGEDKYLYGGGKSYAQVVVSNSKAMPEGVYTLVVDAIDFGSTARDFAAIQQTGQNPQANIIDSWSKKTNEWDTVIAQWDTDLIGTSNMTWYFKSTDATAPVGFDDVKLYFEPKNNVTVTVSTNGRTGKTDKGVAVNAANGKGVTVAELKAEMGCVGISLSTDISKTLADDYVITPKYNKTVYAVWSYEESEFGTLVFEIDFEKQDLVLPGNGNINLIDVATAYNSDLVKKNVYFNIGSNTANGPLYNSHLETDENGNTYFVADAVAGYNFITVLEYQEGLEWLNGTYTYVMDVKTSDGFSGYSTQINNSSNDAVPLDSGISNSPEKWDTIAYQYTGTISENGDEEVTGSLFVAPFINSGNFAIDNVKLFFKTDETVFTIKRNGNKEVNEFEIPVSTTEGITVQEIINKVNEQETRYELLGISTTPTGNVIAPETRLIPDYQQTYYMIWLRENENPMLDDYLGKLLFAVDFEREDMQGWNGQAKWENGENVMSSFASGGHVDRVATLYDEVFDGKNTRVRFLTNDRNVEHFEAGIETDENNNHFLEGTNGKLNPDNPDNEYGKTWGTLNPQVAFVNNDGIVAGDGIYTVFIDVNGPAGNFSIHPNMNSYNPQAIDYDTYEDIAGWTYHKDEWNKFAYKYTVTDGSAIPMSGAYFSLQNYEQTVSFDNYKLYYKPFTATITLLPGEFEGFGVHTVDGISTTGENTARDILEAINSHFEAAGRYAVGLADADGWEIELDAELVIPGDMTYTIIWGEKTNDYAPETWEKSSIRYSPNVNRKGVRFAADVMSEYAYLDATTEYGWIITRKVFLDNAGINYYCFTKESELEKAVSIGKNFGYEVTEEGDDGRKHYSEEDGNIVITAVIYGVPEKYYTEEFVARPYIVVDGVTYYGAPYARSMYAAALAVKDAGYPGCDEKTIAYVDEIIAAVPDVEVNWDNL